MTRYTRWSLRLPVAVAGCVTPAVPLAEAPAATATPPTPAFAAAVVCQTPAFDHPARHAAPVNTRTLDRPRRDAGRRPDAEQATPPRTVPASPDDDGHRLARNGRGAAGPEPTMPPPPPVTRFHLRPFHAPLRAAERRGPAHAIPTPLAPGVSP